MKEMMREKEMAYICEGKYYNSNGEEICAFPNKYKRPCQRKRICPFHSRKIFTEKLKKAIQKWVREVPSIPSKKSTGRVNWTVLEHIRFLRGLDIHGKGSWSWITPIVGSKDIGKINSHAQKYFERRRQKLKKKESIHDITVERMKSESERAKIMKDHDLTFQQLWEAFPLPASENNNQRKSVPFPMFPIFDWNLIPTPPQSREPPRFERPSPPLQTVEVTPMKSPPPSTIIPPPQPAVQEYRQTEVEKDNYSQPFPFDANDDFSEIDISFDEHNFTSEDYSEDGYGEDYNIDENIVGKKRKYEEDEEYFGNPYLCLGFEDDNGDPVVKKRRI